MKYQELEKLKEEFKRIKEMGYVKSSRRGLSGPSKTFEILLQKGNEEFFPNYHSIEIITKLNDKKNYMTLFHAAPSSKNEIKRLVKKFGYPDEILRSYKILKASVQANTSTLTSEKYLFKLSINYEKEKIFLTVTDQNYNIIDTKTYWDFKTLKEKLKKKSPFVAYIKTWTKTIDNIDYYKYYDIYFYELKSFKEFLKLIENGIIRITFNIQVFRKGKRIGQIHDLGTNFEIQEIDKNKLYKKINI